MTSPTWLVTAPLSCKALGSCAPLVKEAARLTAVQALTNLDWGRTVRAVRINGLDTPWCYGDVIELVTGAREALARAALTRGK